jgi:hypothetical protein
MTSLIFVFRRWCFPHFVKRIGSVSWSICKQYPSLSRITTPCSRNPAGSFRALSHYGMQRRRVGHNRLSTNRKKCTPHVRRFDDALNPEMLVTCVLNNGLPDYLDSGARQNLKEESVCMTLGAAVCLKQTCSVSAAPNSHYI